MALLAVWLNPLLYLPGVCGAVFHCHSCPLSSLACPVGVIGNFASWHVFPFVAVGVLLAVAASAGALLCGWACPFGLLQDLLAKIPTRKFRLPSWLGYGRYAALAGLVLAVPFWLGTESALFFCRLCPAATIESAIPDGIASGVLPSVPRLAILGLLLAAVLFHRRPWCRTLCPLGGMLALGNRWSLFRLRWDEESCTHCGKCATDCPYGVGLPERLNSAQCLRCLECTGERCGAIRTAWGPGR